MTTREQAIKWFNGLSSLRKTQLCDTNTDIVGSVRRWETLTGSEIEKIWRKEIKTEEKELSYILEEASKRTTCASERMGFITAIEWQKEVALNRLKEQYKFYKQVESEKYNDSSFIKRDYLAMRLFCLDTQLVSFNDIEAMESEVNQSFS